ncbi:MAG: type IV pilus twitching motility protein PilT [Candidatus Buchananbacteria bacterium]|jgi:twitching motility protein PilT|nr:type IV pilus twitching motility protein PilT [Candidatus Buchananbacteria bacterium]
MRIDELLHAAVSHSASDIHLIADMRPQVRIDGELVPLDHPVLTATELEALVRELLTESQWKKFSIEKDLDISHENTDGNRFRINLHFERGRVGLSARTIPARIPTMEDLGMPPIIYKLCDLERGLILLTGPTGSGKSTSLAAMINYINEHRSTNIITLEDPIEFVFKPIKSLIRQRQLGTDMLNFQSGLIHVLRQDPNIVMVGEMRNLETIATAITLAETGHLVFATLHTYSAPQTIDRIIDIFPPYQQSQIRMQVSVTLQAIIAQRLLPRTGRGRVAAREVLLNTPAVSNLIRENKISQIKTVMQTGGKEGMITMDTAITQLYKQNEITKEVYDTNVANTYAIKDGA